MKKNMRAKHGAHCIVVGHILDLIYFVNTYTYTYTILHPEHNKHQIQALANKTGWSTHSAALKSQQRVDSPLLET